MNKEHLHNHIIINAYLPDGVSKFGMDSARRLQIRELSDTIQRSYGIEITLADPKTQLFKSKGRGTYREWDSIRKNISWKLEILRRVGNRYQPKKLLTTLPTTKKIEMMEQALSTIEKLGLERRSDLEEKLDSTGAKLNHIKSQLKRMEGKRQFYDLVEPLLKDLQDTKRIIDSIEYWPKGAMPDLMLSSFSPEKVQKTRAQCCPMSGSQKRDLYLALQKHPEYTLSGDGFTGVSAMDAGEILNFFRGDCTKPEILKTSTDAAMEKAYRKRILYMKEDFTEPIRKNQIREIKELLSEEKQNIDFSALTQFDFINIKKCYGNQPFLENPISAEQQQNLSRQLKEHGLTLSRDIQYVLPSEYEQLRDYLDGLTPVKPDLLKPSEPASSNDLEKLQVYLDAKGISPSIPLSAMSKKDYQKLFGYVVSLGQTPECLKEEAKDRSAEFYESIQTDEITEKKQFLLLQLRNQMQELAELGIDPLHTQSITAEISAFRRDYETLSLQKAHFSQEYRSLLELSQQLTYAESKDFLFGALFDEKVHEKPVITVSRDKEQKDMPTKPHPKTMDFDL